MCERLPYEYERAHRDQMGGLREDIRDLKRKRRAERGVLKQFLKAFGPFGEVIGFGNTYHYSPSGVMISVEIALAARKVLRSSTRKPRRLDTELEDVSQ